MVSILISWEWGKPLKYKIQWVSKHSGLSDTPSLTGGHFYTVWCNTVDHVQSSGGRPQKLVRGNSRGLWWFMTPLKTWQLPLMPVWLSQLCPVRRDENLQACVWMPWSFPREKIHNWACYLREDIGMTKSIIPPLQALLLTCLLPYGAQTPAYPLVVDAHPLCTWPVTLQTWPRQSTHCYCKWLIAWVTNHEHFSLSRHPAIEMVVTK